VEAIEALTQQILELGSMPRQGFTHLNLTSSFYLGVKAVSQGAVLHEPSKFQALAFWVQTRPRGVAPRACNSEKYASHDRRRVGIGYQEGGGNLPVAHTTI